MPFIDDRQTQSARTFGISAGLRESLKLSWDADQPFCIDLAGRHPQFRILQQKSGKQQLLPMTPNFAEWILKTPELERIGRVFLIPVGPDATGRVIFEIGETARVVVDKAAGKFATAHDLRRSFGTRWSQRVMPVTLQKLMRYADVKTTMAYYVHREADEIASELWRMHTYGDTPLCPPESGEAEKIASRDAVKLKQWRIGDSNP